MNPMTNWNWNLFHIRHIYLYIQNFSPFQYSYDLHMHAPAVHQTLMTISLSIQPVLFWFAQSESLHELHRQISHSIYPPCFPNVSLLFFISTQKHTSRLTTVQLSWTNSHLRLMALVSTSLTSLFFSHKNMSRPTLDGIITMCGRALLLFSFDSHLLSGLAIYLSLALSSAAPIL